MPSPASFGAIAERLNPLRLVELSAQQQLRHDGGDVEILDIKDTTIYCRLLGACQGCANSNQTLCMMVEQTLKDMVDERIRVIGA